MNSATHDTQPPHAVSRKSVLIVAFHFPPAAASSGVQRAFSLARYLRQYGWEPIVLTAKSLAYPVRHDSLLGELPDDLLLYRAFALDVARHLSIRGRYPDRFALPDRWSPWIGAGIRLGKRIIRRHKPALVFSTFPIASAHVIARALCKASGLPWIADFRDSMTEEGYPKDLRKRERFLEIEDAAAAEAASLVFTSPGTMEMYKTRFAASRHDSWRVIANGFDEDLFTKAENAGGTGRSESPDRKLVLLHSGVIYPHERDPTGLFEAVRRLDQRGDVSEQSIEIRLRATGHDAHISKLIEKAGVQHIVKIASRLPYLEAIRDVLDADGLLLLQSANCNHQTPAKLYEYLRAQSPILALTDPAGDTAGALSGVPAARVARLDAPDEIAGALMHFIEECRQQGRGRVARETNQYSRSSQVEKFATLFDDVSGL